ncbi:MAG: MBL fold metallo-hydrolase [Bacteroidetes bacterium]|nr:MBL fold metallo-hydrolase [Bacteroidota bacterium]
MKKIVFAFLLTLGNVAAINAQPNLDTIRPEITQIANQTWLITLYGVTNLVNAGDDGVLMVDAGYRMLAPKLFAAVDSLAGQKPDYIVSTHWHFDHVAGNLAADRKTVVIAHENCRNLLSSQQEILGRKMEAHPDSLLPDITFTDLLTLYLNGDTIVLKHYAGGHTTGDIVVWFKHKNLLHVGDLIFEGMFPFVDVAHGGNPKILMQNLTQIVTDFPAGTRIFCGHGEELTLKYVAEYADDLLKSIKIIESLSKKGKTPSEIATSPEMQPFAKYAVAFSLEDWVGRVVGR